MSIEQLLLFLLFLAIPLLERLIRAMRAQTGGSPAERTPAPAEATVSRPRAPASVTGAGRTESEERVTELPLPGASVPPALPQAVRRAALEQLPASAREPRMRRNGKHGPATTLRARHSDRRPAVRRVIAGGDLRRAIVLIAILGPCRALEPRDASQLG